MGTVTKLETMADLIQEHMEIAKKIYAEDGEVRPMLIGYSGEKRIMMPLMFENEQEKEMLLRMVGMVCIAEGVTRYTVAFEGWSLKGEGEDGMKEYDRLRKAGLRIEDSPMRQEILSCMASSYGERKMIAYNIDEKDRSLTVMSETEGDGMQLQGRFFEILPPQKPTAEQRAMAKQILDASKMSLSEMGGTEETLH